MLKIKVKPKIVADGLDDGAVDLTQGGAHIDAKTFNKKPNPRTNFEAHRRSKNSNLKYLALHYKYNLKPDHILKYKLQVPTFHALK